MEAGPEPALQRGLRVLFCPVMKTAICDAFPGRLCGSNVRCHFSAATSRQSASGPYQDIQGVGGSGRNWRLARPSNFSKTAKSHPLVNHSLTIPSLAFTSQ